MGAASTSAISVLRIKFLFMSKDFTWENVDPACWSIGELGCGITCSSLPTLRPLVAKVIPAFFSRLTGGAKGQQEASKATFLFNRGKANHLRDAGSTVS